MINEREAVLYPVKDRTLPGYEIGINWNEEHTYGDITHIVQKLKKEGYSFYVEIGKVPFEEAQEIVSKMEKMLKTK